MRSILQVHPKSSHNAPLIHLAALFVFDILQINPLLAQGLLPSPDRHNESSIKP